MVTKNQRTIAARRGALRRYAPFYLMLLLPTSYYIIFRYLPMYGLTIAFKNYDFVKGILGSDWATPWYKYYQQFFNSPYCWRIIRNTLVISMLRLAFGVLPPILLAILLNECRVSALKRTVQTLTYMPHFLSWIIVYGITLMFFSQTSGFVNKLIMQFGGKAVPFLQSNGTFRWMLVGTSVWKETGWAAIIYLAAITAIDPGLYEAARIDGAGRVRSIWYITLPCIRPTIVVLLLMRVGNILDAGFEQVYVFYNTHVMETADILDTWVYRTGLLQLKFSLSSAVGLFKSVIGLVMITGTNALARLWGESLW